MENCPSCKHEFKSIEDFPRVKVLKVERGDLEELVEKKVIKVVAKSQTDPTKHYVLL